MPKTRKPSPKKRTKSLPVSIKFKLGGRKSTTSALSLDNTKLLEMYTKITRKKDKRNLKGVIRLRGLVVPKTQTIESVSIEEALT